MYKALLEINLQSALELPVSCGKGLKEAFDEEKIDRRKRSGAKED